MHHMRWTSKLLMGVGCCHLFELRVAVGLQLIGIAELSARTAWLHVCNNSVLVQIMFCGSSAGRCCCCCCRVGHKAARGEIAAAKVCAPAVALQVIDAAIQVGGAGLGGGVKQVTGLGGVMH